MRRPLLSTWRRTRSSRRRCARGWAGVSSLAIAHRLATLMHCDRVVVMSEGRAVEQGPPLELRDKAGSRFAELWAASAHSAEVGC